MMRMLVMLGVLCLAVATSSTALACPVCNEPLGQQVRAGIFDESFGSNLIVTLLPFVIFLGVVAAIHGGEPRAIEQSSPTTPDPADHA